MNLIAFKLFSLFVPLFKNVPSFVFYLFVFFLHKIIPETIFLLVEPDDTVITILFHFLIHLYFSVYLGFYNLILALTT